MSSHWMTYVGEIFYFWCCDSLQRHWMMWFGGFTPCRSNCKVQRYIDNGTCKKKFAKKNVVRTCKKKCC